MKLHSAVSYLICFLVRDLYNKYNPWYEWQLSWIMLKRINCEEFQESETLCMYMTCNFGMQHGLQFVSQRLPVRGIFVQEQTLLDEFKVDFCSTNLAKDYFLSFLSDIYKN